MSDEVKKQFDAFYLFVRTDEKYEEVAAKVHDMRLAVENLTSGQAALEARVNSGVAVRGKENSDAIAALTVRVALLEKTTSDLASKIDDQIFHEETGLFAQFKEFKQWKETLNLTVVIFFITSVAGAIILWALKNFRW